jgi:hypothetical protein
MVGYGHPIISDWYWILKNEERNFCFVNPHLLKGEFGREGKNLSNPSICSRCFSPWYLIIKMSFQLMENKV